MSWRHNFERRKIQRETLVSNQLIRVRCVSVCHSALRSRLWLCFINIDIGRMLFFQSELRYGWFDNADFAEIIIYCWNDKIFHIGHYLKKRKKNSVYHAIDSFDNSGLRMKYFSDVFMRFVIKCLWHRSDILPNIGEILEVIFSLIYLWFCKMVLEIRQDVVWPLKKGNSRDWRREGEILTEKTISGISRKPTQIRSDGAGGMLITNIPSSWFTSILMTIVALLTFGMIRRR